MKFTEEDIPLMKLIFNPETHSMGMLVGQRRAEEIFEYVCNEIRRNKEWFIWNFSDFFGGILTREDLCYFFWDNNILQLSFLKSFSISYILKYSPITEKIWDSGKLDIGDLSGYDIYWLLKESPIAKKIWDSGKLNLSLLSEKELREFK